MAAVRPVVAVSERDVEPIDLPGGSWSRILIDSATAADTTMTMGRSLFKAGAITRSMRHTADEVAVVVEGAGFLMLEEARMELVAGEACYIPSGVWHAVGAGEADMTMVFGFSSPSYPPTEFREAR